MASKTAISGRYGSLVPPSDLMNMAKLYKRTASAASALSQLSATSSTYDFIDAKIESISANLAVNNKFRVFFQIAKKRKVLTNGEYNDAVRVLESEVSQKERELITLKRQKKSISDDMDEVLPQYSAIEDAYSSVLMTKIMSASRKQRRGRSFDQSAYSKAVLSFYGAERCTSSGYREKYCHLTGWHAAQLVKCAHIVPKSLESDELAYLFGVREAVLSEPRNGITLTRVIEGGLDNGWIVLVPDKVKTGENAVWRCILVDQSIATNMITAGTKWGDLDGRELKFLTPNQPARRYLYLRYVITFLHQQKLGNMAWVDRVDARGYLWATPGPYLRKSMLLTLARRISDTFLPEAFYDSTFTIADGSPQRSPEDEDDLAMGLDYKMRDALTSDGGDDCECEDSDWQDE
ncbi:hypothetical protein OIDMADRAFT_55918 [Oidiodendron maius Zn]|uniref:HNH nuclease domain-containing protein n=1 Tax=Oidiodendron maius (strain Zn) TaxID=913774 RepID=A0A0C3H9V0_OIDMZ|nr:hypothetical protein OIDMADRAFT_55918 [Oidiodendron maius Zn]